MQRGVVVSVNVSSRKGERKAPVGKAAITAAGIEGDAHAGDWHRQVSLLGQETIDAFRDKLPSISPGDFAENITTMGIEWKGVRTGQKVSVGSTVLEITQIGKECHASCEIRRQVGDCVMPREGIFAKVVKAGSVREGDEVVVEDEVAAR